MDCDMTPVWAAYAKIALGCVVLNFAFLASYTTIGSFLKVRIVRMKIGRSLGTSQRYGPIIVSNALYSLIFVNPWVLLNLDNLDISMAQFLLFVVPLIFFLLKALHLLPVTSSGL